MWIGSALSRVAAVVVAGMVSLPWAVQAAPVAYDLSFSTSGQSIWGSGESFTLNQTTFIGAAWQDQRAGIDLMVGDEDTNIFNPLRAAYDLAFDACRGLGFSASACINGQSARVPVPALGSRPSVRSCGKFAFTCQAARLLDLGRRATYDTAFAACRSLGFSASVCRNGQSGQLPVLALGTAPPQFLEVDTRTGVAAEATSDGRVGLELGVAIDSGSVDATVSYQATLDIPEGLTLADKATPINFNANSQLAGVNTLETSFSSVELSVDAIMELSGSVTGEACVIGAGCVVGSTPFDIAERAPVLSFNKDGEGGILFLGQSPSFFGIPNADGFPVDLDVAGLATATLHLPQPNTSGGLDPTTQTLKAAGQDDFFDLILDVDNIVATAAGVPGLFGDSVDIGTIGTIGFDIINVEMGPTVDLRQEFEFDPTLFVQLVFDEAVMIGGEFVTVWESAWDLLPDILFLADVTMVTPTFFIEGLLENMTLLDFDLEFSIDLLQVFFEGILGLEGQFGIGNILSEAIDLFQSPNLFESIFGLGGFNALVGDPFFIDFLGQSSLPTAFSTLSIENEIVLEANPDTVPEPGAILLLLVGLLGLGHAMQRRRAGGSLLVLLRFGRSPSMA